jgi:hypothetical protein
LGIEQRVFEHQGHAKITDDAKPYSSIARLATVGEHPEAAARPAFRKAARKASYMS